MLSSLSVHKQKRACGTQPSADLRVFHAYINFSFWKEFFSTFLVGCLFHMLSHAALLWVFLEGCSRYLFFRMQLLPSLTSQHFAQPTHSDLGYFRPVAAWESEGQCSRRLGVAVIILLRS